MSAKSDYFFELIKQVYPSFPKPAPLEAEVWAEVLEPYKEETILKAVKDYRKSTDTPYAPTPAKFSEYLYEPQPEKPKGPYDDLPLSPESYLIAEDAKAGRLKYFFPTYVKAVQYLINEKTKEVLTPEEYKKTTYGRRYHIAVDNGFFSDFDKTLDMIAEKDKLHGAK